MTAITETDEPAAGSAEHAALSSSSPSSLTIDWTGIGADVATLALPSSAQILVENHEAETLEGTVTVELEGLGVKRVVDLGKVSLGPNEQKTLTWNVGDSPIAPVGSNARALPRVAFTRADVTAQIPGHPLYFAFDESISQAFVSTTSGRSVRQRSLGRTGDGTSKADRSAALDAMRARRGHVDHRPLTEAESKPRVHQLALAAEGAAADPQGAVRIQDDGASQPEELVGDSISFRGEGLPVPASTSTAATVTPQDFTPIPVPTIVVPPANQCILPVNNKSAKVCASWRPSGFIDELVGGTGSSEDYAMSKRPASYAMATFYENGTAEWTGRLDADGCTPVQNFCILRELRLDVSSMGMQRPDQLVQVGNTLVTRPGTRRFDIKQGTTFSTNVLLASSTVTGETLALSNIYGDTPDSEHIVRVAAVVSRILTMTDSGVLPPSGFPLTIHTENGCMSGSQCAWGLGYPDPQKGPKCGEACGSDNEVWFGFTLSKSGSGYEPNGKHTTDSKFVIAHELGHTVQWSTGARPSDTGYTTGGYGTGVGDAVSGYNDQMGEANCSCQHVTDGNQLHCLQSGHFQPNANKEGFAHFFATRVMNDQAADARFTYYKSTRQYNYINNVPVQRVIAPPAPINAAVPFQLPGLTNAPTGWVRNFCAQPNRASEYDWLTFLWGVNGSAVSTERSSMEDVLEIVKASSEAFIWPNIRQTAETRFGQASLKAQRFRTQGELNGLTL